MVLWLIHAPLWPTRGVPARPVGQHELSGDGTKPSLGETVGGDPGHRTDPIRGRGPQPWVGIPARGCEPQPPERNLIGFTPWNEPPGQTLRAHRLPGRHSPLPAGDTNVCLATFLL